MKNLRIKHLFTYAAIILLCAAVFLSPISASADSSPLAGDVNNDGVVSNRDASRILQYLSGWDVEVNEDALDANGDGEINNRDAIRILQYLSGWDVELNFGYSAPSDGLLYTLTSDKKGYNVSGIGTCTDLDIVIPNMHEGLPVVGIASEAFFETNITSVTMPDTIITVGSAAFYDCTALTTVILGKNVEVIEGYVFCNNSENITVTMYDKVKSIGAYAFGGTFTTAAPHILYQGTEEQFDMIDYDSSLDFLFVTHRSWFISFLHYHTADTLEGYAPTCTQGGYTDGEYCAICGIITKEREAISARGHTLENGRCKDCGFTSIDFTNQSLYHSDYGYNALGNMTNGANLQKFYRNMDEILSAFHSDVDRDVTSSPSLDVYYPIADVGFSECGISLEEAQMVWNVYICDHPLYYWLENVVGANFVPGSVRVYTHKDFILGEKRAEYNAKVYAFSKAFAESISGEDSPYRITLAAHDLIAGLIDYAYGSDGNPESALWAHRIIGVIEQKGGVCEAYAQTLQLLLNLCDVENIFIEGDGNGPHAWNLVKLDDGEWYWVDLTWDDGNDSDVIYNYFAVNDTQFTNWRDEFYGYSDSYSGDSTFIDSHTPYGTDYSAPSYRTYLLPSRSENEFSHDGVTELRETFTQNGLTYSVIGYNEVQLIYADGTGTVIVPERVTYGSVTYTVTAIGAVNEKGYFSANDIATSNGVTKIIIPESVEVIWSNALASTALKYTVYIGAE